MIIPVRCFTCGKVVGSAFPAFVEKTRQGENPAQVLDALGLKRYCCRRMILSHAERIDEVLPFGCVQPEKPPEGMPNFHMRRPPWAVYGEPQPASPGRRHPRYRRRLAHSLAV